ncbi:TIGR01440 family protein [Pelagirhabdus alkalitolerans]|nr:TIGR01440 family protein [Pelagirhabdus alkalitolerans]
MNLTDQLTKITEEWKTSKRLNPSDLFVIGTSTSEVGGHHIGTDGSTDVAKQIFDAFIDLSHQENIELAFQCCEHLNRALVVERHVQKTHRLTEVAVVPHKKAGGSMATYAYQQMEDSVVVEQVEADAGIDIGETMIGMHLKPVAVPMRLKQNYLNKARVNAAYTRPKLIGGVRATYE